MDQKIVAAFKDAERVAVLTGAGVSAESGIPTFRGEDGLWKEYRAEELATPRAFQGDPALVWEWYHWRRKLIRSAAPNPAHRALVRMEDRLGYFCLITQNVDGLHHAAGSRNILELHGNIHRARCPSCSRRIELAEEEGVPTCPDCGATMRPDVVWFGENLDMGVVERAFSESGRADMFLVAGTSGVVQPAASLALAARERGGVILEINLDPTPLTGTADYTVLGKAGEILPELVRMAWGEGWSQR